MTKHTHTLSRNDPQKSDPMTQPKHPKGLKYTSKNFWCFAPPPKKDASMTEWVGGKGGDQVYRVTILCKYKQGN